MSRNLRLYIGRKISLIMILLAVILTIKNWNGTYPAFSNLSDSSLTFVHFIDVGQADSVLIESGGQVLLIDAGNHDDSKTIIKYIKKRGIDKLDYVIGTHPHEDHIGGLADVIKEFKVGKIFLTDYILPSASFDRLLAVIKKKELQVVVPGIGDKYTLGYTDFVFVAPVNKDYGSKVNNYSLGIKLTDRENTFLLTADAEEVSEMDMAESGMDLKADVLKINHHGSISSSTEIFIDAVDPVYAVISVGKDNPYGNPSNSVITRLLDHDVQIYRTDLMGTITVVSDGRNLIFKTEKKDDKNVAMNN